MGRRKRRAGRGGAFRGRLRRQSSESSVISSSENNDPTKMEPDDEDNSSSSIEHTLAGIPESSSSLTTECCNNSNLLPVDIFPLSMVPDVDGEDVVLNRKGAPVRTKKQNYEHDLITLADVLKPSLAKSGSSIDNTSANTTSSNRKRMEQLDVNQGPRMETRLKRRNSTLETKTSDLILPVSKSAIQNIPPREPNFKKVKRISDPPRPFRRIRHLSREDDANSSTADDGQIQPKLQKISPGTTNSLHAPPPPPVVKTTVQAISKKKTRSTGALLTSTSGIPKSPLPSMPDLLAKEVKQEPTSPPTPPNSGVLPFPLMSERDRSLMMKSTELLNYPSLPSDYHAPLTTIDIHALGGGGNQIITTPSLSLNSHLLHRRQPKQHSLFENQHKYQEDFDKQSRAKRAAQAASEISQRLRNMVKLPKAHRWLTFEFFYGDVDRALLEGENDFQVCLRESYPGLKTQSLTRTEWRFIRRTMGKPRRCSPSFLREEREELDRKREKMRVIQRRDKLPEDWTYTDLPDFIPLSLRVGTKVTARVRSPIDGLFNGTVQGVDLSDNTYRIRFDRKELGSQSITDCEVMSLEPPDTFAVASHTMKLARHVANNAAPDNKPGTYIFRNSLLLSETLKGIPKSPFPPEGMLGGFPIRLLELIVRFSKLLKVKREKNLTLAALNVEAEKLKAYGQPYSRELKRRYAKCILELDELSALIGTFMHTVQIYCSELSGVREYTITSKLLNLNEIAESACNEAKLVVSTYNNKAYKDGIPSVCSPKIRSLVEQITSMLLQVRILSTQSGDRRACELTNVQESLKKIKTSLEGKNVQVFQNRIELPMKRIMAGLCRAQQSAKPSTNDAPKRYTRSNK